MNGTTLAPAAPTNTPVTNLQTMSLVERTVHALIPYAVGHQIINVHGRKNDGGYFSGVLMAVYWDKQTIEIVQSDDDENNTSIVIKDIRELHHTQLTRA